MSTSLSWLAKQSCTRHRAVTTAATLAEDTHVVVPLESALLVGTCRCLREKNPSRTRRATTPNVTKVSAIAVSELVRSAISVRSLCQLDDESSEAHCAFCDQPRPANDLGNDPAQSRALANDGTARAVPLLDPLHPCT